MSLNREGGVQSDIFVNDKDRHDFVTRLGLLLLTEQPLARLIGRLWPGYVVTFNRDLIDLAMEVEIPKAVLWEKIRALRRIVS